MNIKLLASAASAVIVVAAFATEWGWAGQSSVEVTARVGPVCNWQGGGADVNLLFGAFVDTNSRLNEQSYQLPLGHMNCNQPAYVSLKTERGGMKSREEADCAGGGNSRCVNYVAKAEWNNTSVTYETDGTAMGHGNSDISGSGGNKMVRVTVTPKKPAGDVPLVAGEFTDRLTVQVGPPM